LRKLDPSRPDGQLSCDPPTLDSNSVRGIERFAAGETVWVRGRKVVFKGYIGPPDGSSGRAMISYPGETAHRVVLVDRIGRSVADSLERSAALRLGSEQVSDTA
jgi:hypothetical protein